MILLTKKSAQLWKVLFNYLYSMLQAERSVLAQLICDSLISYPMTFLKYGARATVLWPLPQPISTASFKLSNWKGKKKKIEKTIIESQNLD